MARVFVITFLDVGKCMKYQTKCGKLDLFIFIWQEIDGF